MRYTRGNGVTGNESMDLTNTPLSELLLNNSSEEWKDSHSGVQLVGQIPDITINAIYLLSNVKVVIFYESEMHSLTHKSITCKLQL